MKFVICLCLLSMLLCNLEAVPVQSAERDPQAVESLPATNEIATAVQPSSDADADGEDDEDDDDDDDDGVPDLGDLLDDDDDDDDDDDEDTPQGQAASPASGATNDDEEDDDDDDDEEDDDDDGSDSIGFLADLAGRSLNLKKRKAIN